MPADPAGDAVNGSGATAHYGADAVSAQRIVSTVPAAAYLAEQRPCSMPGRFEVALYGGERGRPDVARAAFALLIGLRGADEQRFAGVRRQCGNGRVNATLLIDARRRRGGDSEPVHPPHGGRPPGTHRGPGPTGRRGPAYGAGRQHVSGSRRRALMMRAPPCPSRSTATSRSTRPGADGRNADRVATWTDPAPRWERRPGFTGPRATRTDACRRLNRPAAELLPDPRGSAESCPIGGR